MSVDLLLRVDASDQLGMGHFMRGLALAQAWRLVTGGRVHCLSAELPPAARARLARDGIALMAPSAGAALQGAWLVIDGRHFSVAEVAALAAGATRSLVIDDHGALARYPVDLVVNPNLYGEDRLYAGRVAPGCRLLCGSRYALLRPEIIAARGARVAGPTRLLVTLGGSDPHGLSGRLAVALLRAADPAATITVVIGPAATPPDLGPLSALESKRLRVLRQPDDWPAIMAQSDVALSAAGTTLLELAALGVPGLWVSNNAGEVDAARRAEAEGFGRYLGPVETAEGRIAEALAEVLARRAAMAAAGRHLVDGEGAARVVATMLEIAERDGERRP